ncbi:hypothetical protein [Nitrincola sp.]|uniref:hypothetical protein n=1 Tax=Nitrincola sp. TaxID=1926584 RepID=UPI003A90F4AB
MSDSIEFYKTELSEWVLRNALYWISPFSAWTLDETPSTWIVGLEVDSNEVRSELNRLINDYALRESLKREFYKPKAQLIQLVIDQLQARKV